MLGFTRRETGVLIFLIVTFIIGFCIWVYRQRWEPIPEIVYDNKGSIKTESFHQEEKIVVSLNRGSKEDFERLEGIGTVVAERIVRYRKDHGGFKRVEELMEVRGIGKKKFQKIKPYIILN